MNFKQLTKVQFPKPSGININMMPIIMGERHSTPYYAWEYWPLIEQCNFLDGSTVYLTVNESVVDKGITQRRPGLHTDGTASFGWGGGGWGGKKGIYTASTDGRCKVWDEYIKSKDKFGALNGDELTKPGHIMLPNTMYWMTDRTPHESLPSLKTTMRQFFRLVSEDVDIWYSKHSTPNPLGIQPRCMISDVNKFAS